MSVSTMLDDAKNSLADLKRKYKFKKANDSRKEAAELQSSMAKCRGQLEICTKEFKRTITTQCRNIAEGKKQHADTLIQEQILWDAAIGYMLVKDAIYAIKTINSHDSISHAYDMLDAAVAQMSGKKNKLLDIPHLKKPKDRNAYGYIASGSAVKEKEILLDSFFETLKETADIDIKRQLIVNTLHTKGRHVTDNALQRSVDLYLRQEQIRKDSEWTSRFLNICSAWLCS